MPYHLSYGGTGLQFVNGAASLVRRERTRGHPRRNELRITTPGNGRLPAGEYSDTITISITAR